VAVVTLGCSRNEVDSEELAGRLEAGGFALVEEPAQADSVLVNTCGFVEAAKKDSIDALLEASELKSGSRPQAVVAVGCLAERYGADLADALPEADAVLGFDDYPDIAARLRSIVAGERHVPHSPRDRRTLLPISPAARRTSTAPSLPGHSQAVPSARAATAELAEAFRVPPDLPPGVAPASGPRVLRRRLGTSPVAPLKLASGCDRRCTFCAIPSFRGSFVSRPPADILAEAAWLAERGVRELFLVSENSTSYGKDLGDLRSLEALLPALCAVPGVRRVRVSYLQPAEMRPSLIAALTSTDGVAPYFDLSFQHASGPVLRRMRRFGDGDRFLRLLDDVRALSPLAGARSNFIVGFPGETDDDIAMLCDFLEAADLDAVGVFGYSDEDGTEATGLDDKLDADEIRTRTDYVVRLAEELTAQRAARRTGEQIQVLLESRHGTDGEGRAESQGPDVDGSTTLTGLSPGAQVGDIVPAVVTGSTGVDLLARVVGT
jgi:ribosomal protein S12 methylthiotransferase